VVRAPDSGSGPRERSGLGLPARIATPEAWARNHYWVVALSIAAMVSAYLAGIRSPPWGHEGWLPATSAIALTVGLWLGLRRVDDVYRVVDRLRMRGILVGNAEALKDLLAVRGRRAAAVTGPLVAGLMTVVFLVVMWDRWLSRGLNPEWLLVILAIACGYLAGRIVGHAIAHGTLGSVIERSDEWSIKPLRNSPDGASGLAPVGELYFRNAGVLLIPAGFLAAWLWLWMFDLLSTPGYWVAPFLVLVAIALLMQLPVFILPMLAFHRQMRASCQAWGAEIDQKVCPRLSAVESQLVATENPARQLALKEEQTLLVEQFNKARRCPTWPVDSSVRRRFTLGNALLLIPLVANAFDEDVPESFRQLSEFLNAW
jgi:hypothetical protein